ncbi:quinol:electron acceptor oxidoreductase subunit ActD [Methylorubrum extorquens]|uniref:quinol:electron acceptor oxidoreductase subunit ActD n=1 Tax=Methylorubrum extorquens TaxID=408 RepID=UPI00223908C2|nr:quinol:electron acceptor oxidoreductase subunit ActD [Methylorubrum extorquens]UYW25804.1 DUF3341 domain-containing protein [Methylorubrum extorquens]UYW34357.1 DUF3341 domain-containing protein [Methylorubrum extorquens]
MTERAFPPAAETVPLYGAPVIGPDETVASIAAALAGSVLAPAGRLWRLAVAGTLVPILVWAGLRSAAPAVFGPAAAAWWIGLAAGCLLISGLLLLAGVAWRCGIGRLTQTAALLCAGLAALYPVPVHPVSLGALLLASLGLWAAALLPDLAVLRDAARPDRRRARLYRALSAGWCGSALQWLAWERACRGFGLLGILAAVAVLIDLALAAALRTDRHDTLLPVALLVEAVLSGAGLIAALAMTLRRSRGLDGLITGRHLDILGRLLLAFGLAALYCHVTEIVTALLYGDAAERARLTRRLLGDEAPAFWILMLAGLLPTQLFWIPAIRRSALALGLIGALVAIGLGADHVLATRIGATGAALADLLTAGVATLGSAGLFVLGLLLLFRLVPPVGIAETRQLALAQNADAAPRVPETTPAARSGPSAVQPFGRSPAQPLAPSPGQPPGLIAIFASEAGLAEAARGLSGPRAPRLDAFGPVPMPEAAAALHREERSLNRLALFGAFLGFAAFLAIRIAGLAGDMPDGPASVAALLARPLSWPDSWPNSWSTAWPTPWPAAWPLSWAMAAVPALSAAAAGGVLGLAVALLSVVRAGRAGRVPPSALAGHFVLTIEPSGAPFIPAALARRLNALPADAGRPLALYGLAAGEPQR